jgi:hypothetical protein
MEKIKKRTSHSIKVAENVRNQIEAGGERLWRLADFQGMPFTAIAQALSRLTRQGAIQRLSKGLYYRPRQTIFGQSKPNLTQLHSLGDQKAEIFPAGNAAANFLGFTTQNAARIEVATNRPSLPRLIVGEETIIHTRRPQSWKGLTAKDAALLDFLRHGGKNSEFSPEETVDKLLGHFQEKGQFERLTKVAESEPPRVRAILGAIGQQIGSPKAPLSSLKESLNPLSRFDFGNLIALKYAKQWQAKEPKAP